MAYVKNSILSNVTVNSASEDAWDFESDAPGIGSGNVIVDNPHTAKGIRLIEALSGPITFVNCECRRHVTLLYEAAASGQEVTFRGGTVLLPNTDNGIRVNGPGHLAFDRVHIGRLPAALPPSGTAWWVTNGGRLTLNESPVAAPLGSMTRARR